MADGPPSPEHDDKSGLDSAGDDASSGDVPKLVRGDISEAVATVASAVERVGRIADLSTSVTPALAFVEQRSRIAQMVSARSIGLGALEVLQKARVLEANRVPLIEASERISRALLGPSMISANLAAETAAMRIASTFDGLDFSSLRALQIDVGIQAESLRRVAELVENQNRALASFRPPIDIARSMSFATRAWDDVVRVSTPERTQAFLERIDVVGRGTGWTVQAGLLLSETDEDSFDELHLEAVATLGPAEASAELHARLNHLDPGLGERLQGAWERIYQGGPHAGAQAAHSLMETVDWTLRTIAPDEEVIAWHTAERRPEKELHNGRPTRTLRLRYAVRSNPEKNSSLDLYMKSLTELVGAIQSPKHRREILGHRSMAPVALSVEALLHFILVE